MEKPWSFRYSTPPKPDGPVAEMTAEEMERWLLQRLAAEQSNPTEALWQLARFYASSKQHEKALDYLRQAVAQMKDPEGKAGGIVAMGQLMEQKNDWESAIRFYQEAFSLEPASTRTWYLIHNNLGYCLNTLGRFGDGESFCRKATAIDANRPNAFKNLGIALQRQGKLPEAAQCFITATRVDAADRRSYDLLKVLLADNPEINFAFEGEAERCREAVEFAANLAKQVQPVIRRGWRKHLFLFGIKLRAFVRRVRKK